MNRLKPLFFVVALANVCLCGQDSLYTRDGVSAKVETVVDGLEVPWAMAFASNGDLYFTERRGRLNIVERGAGKQKLIAELDEVLDRGEGGLMGLALHPSFDQNRWIYLSFTTTSFLRTTNQVVRFTLRNGSLTERTVIVKDLPGATVHNGCRLTFGPDGFLYISTGDAAAWDTAQKLGSLGGKILRVREDGSFPEENPFGPDSPIFAVGVRNPQGLAFDPVSGWLFETEHGPSGFEGRGGGGDEVNIIKRGKNYGWPVITHRDRREGLESPLLEYSPAVAPAGAVFGTGTAFRQFQGNFFFACLRGRKIQRVVLHESLRDSVLYEEELFARRFGRIRDVTFGPDGFLYFATSNRDGRGNPHAKDDRILRVVPLQN